MQNSKGFTLIELMIVVAIIAILAAIAIPQYQNYVARSQVAAGLAEVTGGRTATEELLNRGITPVIGGGGRGDIGVVASSARCSTIAIVDGDFISDGEGEIRCTLIGTPAINGLLVGIVRSSAGVWTCESTVEDRFLPAGCAAP